MRFQVYVKLLEGKCIATQQKIEKSIPKKIVGKLPFCRGFKNLTIRINPLSPFTIRVGARDPRSLGQNHRQKLGEKIARSGPPPQKKIRKHIFLAHFPQNTGRNNTEKMVFPRHLGEIAVQVLRLIFSSHRLSSGGRSDLELWVSIFPKQHIKWKAIVDERTIYPHDPING